MILMLLFRKEWRILISISYPVGWSCRIHQLLLWVSWYDTKQSDGEVPRMWSAPSLPLLLGPLYPGVVAPDTILSVGQIEINCVIMQNLIAVRVFANGPGDLGSIPGRVIPKTLKMELDTTLLNTQHYKVRFKGKVEQSREWSSTLPYTLV